jgi:LysM repeat protein
MIMRAKAANLWRRIVVAVLLPMLAACGGATLEGRATPEPVLRVTAAPTQDVSGTQTALAIRSIPTPTPQGLYIVKPGDTLSSIADNNQTTVDEIIAYNNIADPNQIEVGQELILPSLLTPTGESAESRTATP